MNNYPRAPCVLGTLWVHRCRVFLESLLSTLESAAVYSFFSFFLCLSEFSSSGKDGVSGRGSRAQHPAAEFREGEGERGRVQTAAGSGPESRDSGQTHAELIKLTTHAELLKGAVVTCQWALSFPWHSAPQLHTCHCDLGSSHSCAQVKFLSNPVNSKSSDAMKHLVLYS